MFSGIVEAIGIINFLQYTNDCLYLAISPNKIFDDLSIGDSVSVNGICLSATKIDGNNLYVTAVPETLRLTNLDELVLGATVNLERSIKASSRIGGHFVQGHIDFCGEIIAIENDGKEALLTKISCPESHSKYIVKKGYIALDGMSITVIDAEPNWFSVTFIPATQQATIVTDYCLGKRINIEVDILGKYIEKLGGLN